MSVEWRVERDENGIPRRLVWIPPEVAEAIDKAEEERLERNRTLRYVEPSPYTFPSEAGDSRQVEKP